MKRTLYLECYSGISGDMAVAALLDLGADRDALDEAVDSIRLTVPGFEAAVARVRKAGIDACDFNVILDGGHENHDHDMEYLHGHEHGHHHHHHHGHGQSHGHRGMEEITGILNRAKLTEGARKLALKVFDILAEAEAKAHNVPVSGVHFHEVGAVDSIVDIMCAAVCVDSLMEKYGIDDVVVSELYEGRGSVRCQHGVLPVPVPATANIAQTYGLPMHFMEYQGEFVTPTGVAIAAAVRTKDRLPEQFKIVACGVGAGKRSYEKASLLRAMVLESQPEESGIIYKIETNIDDCHGEMLGYVMERLFEAGAKEVFYTPVYMKKNRPAYQLTVLCDGRLVADLEKIIFAETTTIGVRRVEMERTVLERVPRMADTAFGRIKVKDCGGRAYPEYESLSAVCMEKGIPYIVAYDKVFAELNVGRLLRNGGD